MIFEEKTIILKDGRTAILKSPCVEDAEKLLNYIKKSCSETDFLARYEGIRTFLMNNVDDNKFLESLFRVICNEFRCQK